MTGRAPFAPLPRRRLIGLAVLYALVMLYSSTLIGPTGINFVPQPLAQAWRAFLATPYVQHGSDQRADWIGNLLMLTPFGFLVAGAVWPRRIGWRIVAVTGAVVICGIVVLTIKYLQLFFPPRTVTLNYIMAQSVGALIGVLGWTVWDGWVVRVDSARDPVAALVVALRLYAGALVLFTLMPLDFALDAADLQAQWRRVPDMILALPGSDRPPVVRVLLLIAAAAAFVPVGMMLSFVRAGRYRVRRSLPRVAVIGLLTSAILFAATVPVMSAFPVMPSILYRTTAILAGAAAMRWLVRQDPQDLRRRLARHVPWLMLAYLLGVLLANRLLSAHWLSASAAVAHVYPLGLLPLFDYYIVTKAEAAKNIIGHFGLYLPLGVLLWLRNPRVTGALVFALAAGLSLLVEVGRYLRPGLEGDVNAVALAGVAALAGARLMPMASDMLLALRDGQGLAAGPCAGWAHDTPNAQGAITKRLNNEIGFG